MTKTIRKTIDDVHKLVKDRGYRFLSMHYTSMNEKYELLCPKGHTFSMQLSAFYYQKQGCSKCKADDCSLRCKTPYEEVVGYTKAAGLELLTSKEQYAANAKKKTKIIIKHTCGHITEILYKKNQLKSLCSRCANGTMHKPNRLSLDYVRKEVEARGYGIADNTYISSNKLMNLLCPLHGSFQLRFGDLKRGVSCSACSHHKSQYEMEIDEFLTKELDLTTIKRDRKTLGRSEIDILVPDLKVGIEFNGLYYHSDKFIKNNNKHILKFKKSEDAGIRLITIFEDEWVDRKAQVRGFLRSVFKKNTVSIYARKTKAIPVDKKTAVDFLNKHHIQGASSVQIAFGLYHQDDLVGLIVGSTHHRGGQGDALVLNRLAFKAGYTVQGGSSKLLAALMAYAKSNGYSKIISWSDNRWSQGNVYKKMGFTLEEELPPDYSYTDGHNRFSKQSCQKKHLIKKGAVGNTEKEMAKSIGYGRIWDCGKKRWSLLL